MISPGLKHVLCVLFRAIKLAASPIYATCYFPNGNTDPGYKQCPGSLSCCLEGESCLSNGLCFTANFGILYRGLRADESWPTAECTRACYTEIPGGWANLFQCNTSCTLLTCSHDVSAGTACLLGNALGTYEYTTANGTAAENGRSACEATHTTSVNGTSNYLTNATPITAAPTTVTPTCPSTSSQSELVALGAGLGAGLGVPLLISTAVLINCCSSRRREKRSNTSENPMVDVQHWIDKSSYPSELHGQRPRHKELIGTWKDRSELSRENSLS